MMARGSASAADDKALNPGGLRLILIAATAAFFDGIDVQSMGLALPSLIGSGAIGAGQAGMLAGGSLFGLMLGALAGGVLVDRLGPRIVMLASLVMLGVFSLLTTVPAGFPALLALRIAAGLGMGGILPVILTMAHEAASPRFRATALAMVYGAGPLGSMAAAAVAWGAGDWRWVFYVGGAGPLLLVPALAMLPAGWGAVRRMNAPAVRGHVGRSLFGEGRARVTLSLWCAGALTTLVIYLNLNWLPSILVARGFTVPGAQAAMILFNAGCIVGNLVAGRMIDGGRRNIALRCGYLAAIAAVVSLALAPGPMLSLAAVFAVGVLTVGCQLLLLAIGNDHYPQMMRGTGMGTLVAVNRLGSLTGPIAAGGLLTLGLTASQVLLATTPGLLIAGAVAAFVLGRARPS